MIKKIIFLMLPLVVVYWRSAMAQNATKWLFRGVIPSDGPLGQVIKAGTPPTSPAASAKDGPRRPAQKSLAARVAAKWPLILAFLAGVTVAAWAFSFGAGRN